MIEIDVTKCVRCGGCIDFCPAIAIAMINDVVTIDQEMCEECDTCIEICPLEAHVKDD